MAINYTIEKHGVGFPSKCLATTGGKHIYNILLSEAVDNSWFVGKGAWQSLDLYAEAAPTSVAAKVVGKAANGNFYVEIISTSNALFVYTVPMIAEDFTNKFKAEYNFYNASGDVARAYELAPGDIVEISAEGFDGTVAVGDALELTAITGVTYAQQLTKDAG